MNVRTMLTSISCALALAALPAAGAATLPVAAATPARAVATAPAPDFPYADGVTPQNGASDASARELLALANGRAMIDGTYAQMDRMMQQLPEQLAQGQPLTPRQREILQDGMRRMMAAYREEMSWERLEPVFISMYRHMFTQVEVDAMATFYRTPAGRSMIAKMPLISQYSMQFVQQTMQQVLPRMQAIQRQMVADMQATNEKP